MKLTPEQLRQNAAAMLAFADGKPIQWKHLHDIRWTTSSGPTSEFSWNCAEIEYRPKPEPKVRQWSKPEDVPGPVCWLRAKIQPEILMLVSCIWANGIGLNDGKAVFQKTWDRLFDGEWEHSTDRKTWHPCTVTET